MSYPTRQYRDLPVEKTDYADFLDDDLITGQQNAGGSLSYFKAKLSNLATYFGKKESSRQRVVRLEDWSGLDLTGTNDCASILAAAHAQATTDGCPVIVPSVPRTSTAGILIGSTVDLTASMVGAGASVSYLRPRTRFIPGMTDGSACLRAVSMEGMALRDFMIQYLPGGSPNPNPSGGNVRSAIGLQLGRACAIATAATQANPCVITTRHPHQLQTGDSVRFAAVRGMTELNYASNGNISYTVTRINATSFSIGVNSTGYTAYVRSGLIYPSDLAASTAFVRGEVSNIFAYGMAVGISVTGWLNKMSNLRSNFCTLGFDGSYLNSAFLDALILEGNWQSYQLLGCNVLTIGVLEEESVDAADVLGLPSTIDYSNWIEIDNYSGEGTRSGAPSSNWLRIGYEVTADDVHIRNGFCTEPSGGTKAVQIYASNRWSLPHSISYSKDAAAEAGTSYTPTWTGSGGNPTLGNGTISGYYTRAGGLMTVSIDLTIGGSTTLGTGNWSFSLPLAAERKTQGTIRAFDTSTGTHYIGTVDVAAGATTATAYFDTGQLSATAPVSWASGDEVHLTISYPL